MNAVVIYRTKYGSTKTYAEWISEELDCPVFDYKNISVSDLLNYDTIIYGGGLYAEVINGVHLLTKSLSRLAGKKIVVYSTGITPLDCRDYYDKLVIEKNFKPDMLDQIKVFNFLGKMKLDELSLVHRTALKTLKKIMSGKTNPSEMEKLLIDLCDADGDFSDRAAIKELVDYVKNEG
ncbi:MAG: flavodoxin [Clostridia bacterium]|nr:flavodoxin [Clostridia bacterium]